MGGHRFPSFLASHEHRRAHFAGAVRRVFDAPVHAQNEKNRDIHRQLGRRGAWVEFDGIGPSSIERHVQLVANMKEAGLLDRVLLSHDAGWYSVGEPRGGNVRPYTTLFEQFLPALRDAGFGDKEVRQLTAANPAAAFAVNVRPAR